MGVAHTNKLKKVLFKTNFRARRGAKRNCAILQILWLIWRLYIDDYDVKRAVRKKGLNMVFKLIYLIRPSHSNTNSATLFSCPR
jgi:hypothetical protein